MFIFVFFIIFDILRFFLVSKCFIFDFQNELGGEGVVQSSFMILGKLLFGVSFIVMEFVVLVSDGC